MSDELNAEICVALTALKPKDKVLINTDKLGMFYVQWKEISKNINFSNLEDLDVNEYRVCINLDT
jgi:hypothetical protein